MNESKWILTSRTVWGNVVLALLAFYPPVAEFYQAYPGLQEGFFLVANIIFRAITKREIVWKP